MAGEVVGSALSSGGFSPDVIVVGAGSAGCAAVRRLVDRGDVRVLLLEAGGPDTNPAIHDPARVFELWFAEEDWAYRTVPQAGALERRLNLPRGRVVGGSSCLNAMIHVRGARADYEHWRYLGNADWGWDDVLPVYKRMEDFDVGASEVHGVGGPVHVMSEYEVAPLHAAIIDAAQEVGIPRNLDHNDGEPDGIATVQLTIKDGRRHSAAAAYLGPVANHANLRVLAGAHVRRLLLEGGRCIGVEWERDGQLERANAAAEVVVCAGAIGSPRLLLLSGIGPAQELAGVGVNSVVDLPGVGRNLHDHLLSAVIFSAEREIAPPQRGLGHAQTHLFWRSRSGLAVPDTQPVNFSVPLYEQWMSGPPNAFTLLGGIIRPASRGSVRLSGPDASDELLIDLGALAVEADLATLQASVEQCRTIGAANALSGEWGARELYPGPKVTDPAELRAYIRQTVTTYHHQSGSCKMGVDVDAVVDPRLRVYGVNGLRVADASIMPTVTTGNTNAPSMMIGERVSDFIAERHATAPTAQST
jgi:choline dehydrogenase